MDGKAFLGQLRRIDATINDYNDELEALKSVKIVTYAPRQGDGGCDSSDTVGRLLAKIDALSEKYNRKLDHLIDLRDEAREVIDAIPVEIYRVILVKRYLRAMPWAKIADELHFSIQHTFRLHGKALAAFEREYRKKGENMREDESK